MVKRAGCCSAGHGCWAWLNCRVPALTAPSRCHPLTRPAAPQDSSDVVYTAEQMSRFNALVEAAERMAPEALGGPEEYSM